MKKLCLTLIIILTVSKFVHAQWTTAGTVTTTTNTVGIGTTTPAYPFQLYNITGRSTNSGSSVDFGFESFNNSVQGSRLYFGRSRGTAASPLAVQNGDYIGFLDFYGHDGTALQRSGQLIFKVDGVPASGVVPGAFAFTTAGADGVNIERMRVSSAGNVGIGTTSPAAPLHVSTVMTPGAVTELLRLELRGSNGNELAGEGAAINFYTPVTPSPDVLGAQIYSFRESGVNLTSTTSLRFATNNAGTISDKLVISGTGNVGIGTTDNSAWNLAGSPHKLAVGGSMIATAVTVKLVANWPDYVLKKDYTLPSLADVKNYIDQNQHLPEIPSAQQIEKDGINLGEMNKLLLKKVEELTLYLIEKDKKEKEQEAINKKNTQEIDLLKNQLESITKLLNKN
ncbi:hypothetical protein ACFGVS_16055 [Mucilaginibacter sp. AW1-7]|uniref:hypothetical protein n=1 Tax=Mucilaginibacter sp. AW1-7 TaxID=3349874 RepID=UPI003F732949